MKDTEMARRVDDLGRVVIPKHIRQQLNIQEGDAFEIWLDDNNNIVLKPYENIDNLIDEILTGAIAFLDELKEEVKNTSNVNKIQEIINKILEIEKEIEN